MRDGPECVLGVQFLSQLKRVISRPRRRDPCVEAVMGQHKTRDGRQTGDGSDSRSRANVDSTCVTGGSASRDLERG